VYATISIIISQRIFFRCPVSRSSVPSELGKANNTRKVSRIPSLIPAVTDKQSKPYLLMLATRSSGSQAIYMTACLIIFGVRYQNTAKPRPCLVANFFCKMNSITFFFIHMTNIVQSDTNKVQKIHFANYRLCNSYF